MYIDDLDEDDYEIAIKVVIVGNGAVGKSSMIQRYCKGIFTNSYKKTIGVDFLEKHITACGEDVRLMLWDTAGQEEFDAITKAYYRGAQACVVAFSTTDRASFDAVKKWKRKVEDECGHIPMVLVQNKIDLLHETEVDSHEIEKFARNTGLKLFRTSVKENVNVAKVFQHLAETHIESVSRWSDESASSDDNVLYQIGRHNNGILSGSSSLLGGGGNGVSNNAVRDVRVRFAETGLNDDKDVDSSLTYLPMRLFPIMGSRSNKSKSKGPPFGKPQKEAPLVFGFPDKKPRKKSVVAGGGVAFVLNPFRPSQAHAKHLLYPACHQSSILLQPATAVSSKPNCRVI